LLHGKKFPLSEMGSGAPVPRSRARERGSGAPVDEKRMSGDRSALTFGWARVRLHGVIIAIARRPLSPRKGPATR